MPNSSSRAITNSTVSSESAPRSATKAFSFVTSASGTPSCSATIFLTRASISLIDSSRSEGETQKRGGFYAASAHEHAAIDMQLRPGDVAGFGGAQKRHRRRDLLGRAQPPQRDLCE